MRMRNFGMFGIDHAVLSEWLFCAGQDTDELGIYMKVTIPYDLQHLVGDSCSLLR